ncbi:MAG: hypothetical protein DRO11_05340 [Methanobacteriota archaeon]|nr:MAG: hypothetical protein DRO11_05340 [Euryarchaeota archaeon]
MFVGLVLPSGVLLGLTSFVVLGFQQVGHLVVIVASMVCGGIFGRVSSCLREVVWLVFAFSSISSISLLWLMSRDYLYSHEIVHCLHIFGFVFLSSIVTGLLLSKD